MCHPPRVEVQPGVGALPLPHQRLPPRGGARPEAGALLRVPQGQLVNPLLARSQLVCEAASRDGQTGVDAGSLSPVSRRGQRRQSHSRRRRGLAGSQHCRLEVLEDPRMGVRAAPAVPHQPQSRSASECKGAPCRFPAHRVRHRARCAAGGQAVKALCVASAALLRIDDSGAREQAGGQRPRRGERKGFTKRIELVRVDARRGGAGCLPRPAR
eukprot:scaffold2930_cov105-Isochrysis_galbana.AAC.9